MSNTQTRHTLEPFKDVVVEKERHLAFLFDRPLVTIIVDCREAFTDPEPYATLIAAAPEMLAALMDIASTFPCEGDLSDEEKQVMQIIHRATGR